MVKKYFSLIIIYTATYSFSISQELTPKCKILGNELHCESCNEITSIEEVDNISKLYLNSNKKCNISYIKNLNEAKSITLMSNSITFDSQYDFQKLKTFKSYECFINKFPNFIDKLRTIESLTFCAKEKYIDRLLKELRVSQTLEIHTNSISQIPKEVFKQTELKELTILTLKKSKIAPTKDLVSLKRLSYLYIPLTLNTTWINILHDIKNLKVLHVQSIDVNEETVKSLKTLKKIEKLIVDKRLKQEHFQLIKNTLGKNTKLIYDNENFSN